LAFAITDPARWRTPDSKRIHHALFGVYFEEDIYERASILAPGLMPLLGGRAARAMAERKLIFVHVPRVAGTSIARALYGSVPTRHHSIRYYRAVCPKLFTQVQSFALLRDPFQRFASAYTFVRAGGTATSRLSAVFAAATAHLRDVDDYLSFLEGRDVLELDFVMRPQSWFVCDLETGTPLVGELFVLGDPAVSAYLRAQGVERLPWLNRAQRQPLFLSTRQKARIERLYAQDFALVAGLKVRSGFEAPPAIAAE